MLNFCSKKVAFLILLFPFFGNCQLNQNQIKQIDSLENVLLSASHDSTKIKTYLSINEIVLSHDLEKSRRLVDKVLDLSNQNLKQNLNRREKKFFLSTKGKAFFEYGFLDYFQGNYDGSILNFKRSLGIMRKLNDLAGISKCVNNIGSILQSSGDLDESIKYLMESIKIDEKLGDTLSTASSYNNIGLTHQSLKNYKESISYIKKGLDISVRFKDTVMIARSLNNLGISYFETEKYDTAMTYFVESMKLREAINIGYEVASSYTNVGNAYDKLGNKDKKHEYHLKALEIYEKHGLKDGVARINMNLAMEAYEKGQLNEAKEFGVKSLKLAEEIGHQELITQASVSLYETYKQLGEFRKSLDMYELYIKTKQEIESESNQKEIINQEYKYSYEKEAAKDSIKALAKLREQDAKIAYEKAQKEEAENAQQRNEIIIYFVLAIVAVILFFVYMVVKSLRLVREQKEKVDEAYDELEEKNNEILDSINYAKRIQSAILPPHKVVKSYLPSSFILYKPKDIVAGDFYWLEPLENKVLFAACDCTGHGVPGAMVSVVCNNGLNRAVREHKLVDPGEILNKTREIVISEFEKSEEEVKDGMDVALCSLEGNMLKYAGANNPLWIIRKGAIEIEEIKANKQPIGKFDQPLPYTTHLIELKAGDTFYIFSDGLADQFGGVRGKKYKAANFKKLLISIQNHDMEKQRALIDQTFEEWKGSIEQLDDVCVIGVRV